MPPAPNRSDFPAPMIMNATLDDGRGHGVINPVDGKRYSNRRQFEAEVQAHGCSIVGNDRRGYTKQKPPEIADADVVGDIKRSLQELNSMSDSERANMMAAQDVATPEEMAAAGV